MRKKSLAVICVGAVLVTLSSLQAQEEQDQKRQQPPREKRAAVNDNAPKVGDKAPTFVLKSLDGETETDLTAFRGDKPVVLLFGSYT